MKALVTGGGGFLGGAVVRRLLSRGAAVRSFSRGVYPDLAALGVEVRQGDLVDADAVTAAAQGCDVVFHIAAKAGIWGPYREYYRTNVMGTGNVLAACRRWAVQRLVYTSSPSIVFNGRDMEGVDESVSYARHFEAPYPQTKALAERLVLNANGAELATVALRPHLIWGPGDNHLVPRLLAHARAGRLRRIGCRLNRIDATYIDNAADAHLLAGDLLAPGSSIAGKAYFIAQDEPLPLWELVNRILQCGGLPPVTHSISPGVAYAAGWICELVHRVLRLDGEPRMTRFVARELATAHWFDLGAARRDLGYRPAVSLEEGLRRLERSLGSASGG